VTLLRSVNVTPFHGLIELSDPHATDFPEHGADLSIVASRHSIDVPTREDRHGPITVDVWLGLPPSDHLDRMEARFDGSLDVGSDGVVVGSTVGSALHPVTIGRGTHRLRVYTAPVGGPASAVCFVFDP
jgi:hypothetical protein